jgi:hypothetical protein
MVTVIDVVAPVESLTVIVYVPGADLKIQFHK